MVSTVLQAFDQFKKKLELTETEKSSVIMSHGNIQNILKQMTAPNIIGTLLHGSWKRNTAIRPINDVDILTILDPTNVTESWWHNGLNDAINPRYALDQIKKVMDGKFNQSTIKRDKPCIVIEFQHCNFDIMPVYRSDDGFYIPTPGLDEWGKTKPDDFANKLSEGNNLNELKLVPFIKMMKHWRNKTFPYITSFDLEKLLLDLFTSDYYFTESPRIYQYPKAVVQSLEKIKESYVFNENGSLKMDLSLSNAKIANQLWKEGNNYDSIRYLYDVFGKPFPRN